MEKYERNIGLKTIWLTFVRRYDILLFIFLPILVGSFVVTQFIMTKKYSSSLVVSKTYSEFSSKEYGTVQLISVRDDIVGDTAVSLLQKGIKHQNGVAISESEIKNGITFSKYTTSHSITLTYTSTDKTITKPVLEELSAFLTNELRPISSFSDIYISSDGASVATKVRTPLKYFLIASAAGFGLAFVSAFIYEIADDKVYNCSDIRSLGYSAISIKLPKNKEEKSNDKTQKKE